MKLTQLTTLESSNNRLIFRNLKVKIKHDKWNIIIILNQNTNFSQLTNKYYCLINAKSNSSLTSIIIRNTFLVKKIKSYRIIAILLN